MKSQILTGIWSGPSPKIVKSLIHTFKPFWWILYETWYPKPMQKPFVFFRLLYRLPIGTLISQLTIMQDVMKQTGPCTIGYPGDIW